MKRLILEIYLDECGHTVDCKEGFPPEYVRDIVAAEERGYGRHQVPIKMLKR